MVRKLRPHWRERIVDPKNRDGRPWGVGGLEEHLLVLLILYRHIEVDAMIENKDIGFVHEGQEAEVKIDTFSFTRYGLIHGKVESVSQDSIPRDKAEEKPNAKKRNSEESETSEPSGEELVYSARVLLDKSQMDIDGKLVSLEPGMATTVEIKTGKRHIISYLLSPLIKHEQEAIRER